MTSGAGGLRAVTAGLRGLAAGGAAGVDRALNEDRIRLAVTGLSRAGKTVFITSLVHNLLALGQRRNTLPRLAARLTQDGLSRLRSVEVLPAGAGVLPVFDHAAKLHGLTGVTPQNGPRLCPCHGFGRLSPAPEADGSPPLQSIWPLSC